MSQTAERTNSRLTKITRRRAPASPDKPVAERPFSPETRRNPSTEPLEVDEFDDDAVGLFSIPGRRGPKAKHRSDLCQFRDDLVMVVEEYWPELQFVLVPKTREAELRRLLAAIQKRSPNEASAHLAKHVGALTRLIHMPRIRNDPRLVANALAGFPDISFSTSARKCASQRCVFVTGERALAAYIERKHPRLAGVLHGILPGDTLGFLHALKHYDLRDRKLYLGPRNAKRLQTIWEAGRPNMKLFS
jgi:hypothetical protein